MWKEILGYAGGVVVYASFITYIGRHREATATVFSPLFPLINGQDGNYLGNDDPGEFIMALSSKSSCLNL